MERKRQSKEVEHCDADALPPRSVPVRGGWCVCGSVLPGHMRVEVHTGTLKLIPSLTVGPRPWEERRLLRGSCSTRMPSKAERAFSWFIMNADLLLQLAEVLISSVARYASKQ